MNMCSTKFDSLIAEFPYEADAVSRLANLVDVEKSTHIREYTPARMYHLIQPSNFRVLIQMLTSATELGLLKKVVRVMSPTSKLAGIAEFDSALEIPLTLFDVRTGLDVEVTTDQIRLIYQILPDRECSHA